MSSWDKCGVPFSYAVVKNVTTQVKIADGQIAM